MTHNIPIISDLQKLLKECKEINIVNPKDINKESTTNQVGWTEMSVGCAYCTQPHFAFLMKHTLTTITSVDWKHATTELISNVIEYAGAACQPSYVIAPLTLEVMEALLWVGQCKLMPCLFQTLTHM